MFGNYFYNKRVRTSVSVFGSLFNNIHVLRQNGSGEVISQVKVPLSYAPRRNFIERLSEMNNGEEAERRVAVKLPRMSFEINNIVYDAERQLPKVNKYHHAITNPDGSRNTLYVGTPYILSFTLSIYAKSQDDALQVVEQIVPYFAPQYTVTVKPFADYPQFVEDIPISLQGISFQDDYEGALSERRVIIYDLTFDMKVMFYGPSHSGSIIREVNANLFEVTAQGDQFDYNINITPAPIDASPDQEYGFNVEINDEQF